VRERPTAEPRATDIYSDETGKVIEGDVPVPEAPAPPEDEDDDDGKKKKGFFKKLFGG
jgi:hypothetical protein